VRPAHKPTANDAQPHKKRSNRVKTV